jgi:hypothetical protein
MTKAEQRRFVKQMCEGLRLHLTRNIIEGRVPDTWDGFELRQWAADSLAERWVMGMGRARKRAYNNTRIVNGL